MIDYVSYYILLEGLHKGDESIRDHFNLIRRAIIAQSDLGNFQGYNTHLELPELLIVVYNIRQTRFNMFLLLEDSSGRPDPMQCALQS